MRCPQFRNLGQCCVLFFRFGCWVWCLSERRYTINTLVPSMRVDDIHDVTQREMDNATYCRKHDFFKSRGTLLSLRSTSSVCSTTLDLSRSPSPIPATPPPPTQFKDRGVSKSTVVVPSSRASFGLKKMLFAFG